MPFTALAENENVGIIKGIWFSDAPFFEGDDIRVYTAIQNNSGDEVEGSIEFFDNKVSLGKKSFSALNNRIIESWIDTKALSGGHEFSVKITELNKNPIGLASFAINSESTFSEKVMVVKKDTDGDAIPDDIDDDDDGDGYSDKEEREKGSDPLDKEITPKVIETEPKMEKIGTSLINSLIDSIIGLNKKNNDEVDDYSEVTEKKENSKGEELENNPSPLFIQNISEKNNFVGTLAQTVNSVQDSITSGLEKEQQRISGNKSYPKTEKIDSEKEKDSIDKNRDENKKQTTTISSAYLWLLGMFNWLFSMWWFVVAFLFFGIYILIKIIFIVL